MTVNRSGKRDPNAEPSTIDRRSRRPNSMSEALPTRLFKD